MTIIKFCNDFGAAINARFEVRAREFVLHSRSADCGPALRLVLNRITHSQLKLDAAWLDGTAARKLPIGQRQIHFPPGESAFPVRLFTKLSKRVMSADRDSSMRRGWDDSTKRLCLVFAGDPSDEEIVRVAGWGATGAESIRGGPLPPAAFDLVTAEHIWHAVQQLVSGPVGHTFGKSRGYDVLADDGSRLAPKVVFGLAASEVFGFEVGPNHFKGGPGTRCFKVIDRAGFMIVPKIAEIPTRETLFDPEDCKWVEGQPSLAIHLRRERASGIARAKKEQFTRLYERLHCEECGFKPDEVYGADVGDACIEVHQKALLHERSTESETTLDDLMCVCANCHRIIHRRLRRQLHEPNIAR